MIAAPIPLVQVTTASTALYGGYDFKFVDGEPDHKYICAICTLVSRDPQQVTCCYNTFCNTCLQRLEQHEQHRENSKCPMCKKPLQYFPDGKINREIIALKVYCTNSEEGCKWQGTINETGTSIDSHLNSCAYQLVPCTYECGEKMRRSTLKTHLTNNCPERMVNCQHCKERGTHQLITSRSHFDECPDLPIQCSNEGCNMKPHRRSLASHNETCPKAIIPCEYNTVGCNKKMKREKQEKHNKESITTHLQLTKKQLQVTKEQLQVLRRYFYMRYVCVFVFASAFICAYVYKQLETTKEQIHMTNKQLETTKEHFQVMYEQLESTTKEQIQETHKQLEMARKEQIKVANKQMETTKEHFQAMYEQLESTTKEQIQETHKQLEMARKKQIKEANKQMETTKEHFQAMYEQLEKTTKEQIQVTNKQVETTKEQLKVAKETIKSLKTTLKQINASMTTNEVLKLSQFTKKKGEEEWYSSGFYTSPGGYKMLLRVDANGLREGKGTHVSCYTYLMAGEYDDTLDWPFQGVVTIELLNQLEDKNHKKDIIPFDESTSDESKQRVKEGRSDRGLGYHRFISHEELEYNLATNCQYLKDDSLYFRVSVKATSKTKSWLVGAPGL